MLILYEFYCAIRRQINPLKSTLVSIRSTLPLPVCLVPRFRRTGPPKHCSNSHTATGYFGEGVQETHKGMDTLHCHPEKVTLSACDYRSTCLRVRLPLLGMLCKPSEPQIPHLENSAANCATVWGCCEDGVRVQIDCLEPGLAQGEHSGGKLSRVP